MAAALVAVAQEQLKRSDVLKAQFIDRFAAGLAEAGDSRRQGTAGRQRAKRPGSGIAVVGTVQRMPTMP